MGASQAPDAGAVPVWRSKFYIMIKVTNQEEFEKCLPMLDSPDVECRLLGWELLCGCTDLHRDSILVWDDRTEYPIRDWISLWNEFPYFDGYRYSSVSYSSLIKYFITRSKIRFGNSGFLKLKYNEHTS